MTARDHARDAIATSDDAEGAPEAPDLPVEPIPSQEASRRAAEGTRERERVVGRAGIVAAGTLLSRILGFGRDAFMAALFSRAQIDVFAAALTIPNALRQLLAEGAVASAVVPVLSAELAEGGDERARAFFARARGVSLVVLTLTTVLGVVFAADLARLFAGGYAAIPGKLELTTGLTRVMFPYIFFMGTAALGTAALNAKRRFAVAAFAPGLFNVAIVVMALVSRAALASRGFDASYALAFGVLLGGVLQVLAQVPSLAVLGYAGRPVLDLRDERVRAMLARIVPMMFGLGIYYVELALSRRFLSSLGEGAQGHFYFASRLVDLPQGIFVMALSTAALPSLATFAARGEFEELRRTWVHGMRLALFVAIPCSVALVVMAEPLVTLLFARGQFGPDRARETASALVWQGGAIFTVAAVRQLVPAFYALGDTKTPVAVSAIDFVVFVVLALLLRAPFGHVGISMAVAGSSLVQMLLLFALVRRRLGGLQAAELGRSVLKVIAASAVAGTGGWGVARWCAGWLRGALGAALPGLAGGVCFVVLFFAMTWGLRAEELDELGRPLGRRLARFRTSSRSSL